MGDLPFRPTRSDPHRLPEPPPVPSRQVLVHDLLVIEAWKEFVYPLLAPHLAESVDSVTTYLLLYHEVTVANLLQVGLKVKGCRWAGRGERAV
jgi:hypothetical protein